MIPGPRDQENHQGCAPLLCERSPAGSYTLPRGRDLCVKLSPPSCPSCLCGKLPLLLEQWDLHDEGTKVSLMRTSDAHPARIEHLRWSTFRDRVADEAHVYPQHRLCLLSSTSPQRQTARTPTPLPADRQRWPVRAAAHRPNGIDADASHNNDARQCSLHGRSLRS
jgi:hypothetical protein